MVTGVQTNSHRLNRLHRATTTDSFTNFEQEQPEDDDDEPDKTHLMKAITNVPTIIQRNTQKHKLLQTEVTILERQKERYNEFEHLLLNHIHPVQNNKITEQEKLQFFKSLLREDASEF